MLYARSLGIEQRLQSVLDLIRSGRYSTPVIAEKLGVSVPTVSRDVTALRERGHDIRAERRGDGWRFVLDERGAGNRRGTTHSRGRKAVTA
ncbi:MAG: HTH domain-containing protein [Phycisphaeraceae bacterium]|nr:HTH domain-containing protein [Phycisphaeraceae bacterium]